MGLSTVKILIQRHEAGYLLVPHGRKIDAVVVESMGPLVDRYATTGDELDGCGLSETLGMVFKHRYLKLCEDEGSELVDRLLICRDFANIA